MRDRGRQRETGRHRQRDIGRDRQRERERERVRERGMNMTNGAIYQHILDL